MFYCCSGGFEIERPSIPLAGEYSQYLRTESRSISSPTVGRRLSMEGRNAIWMDFRERAEERLRDHILKFEKKLEDLQKDVDAFRRKDVSKTNLSLFSIH